MQVPAASRPATTGREPRRPAPAPAGWRRLAPWLAAAGLALYVALFLDTAWRGFVRAPYGDAFDILTVELAAQDRHDPGFYLWGPHNGHHIVWLRLLTSLDVRLFHGRSLVFWLAALLAALATAAMLAQAIRRGLGGGSRGLAAAAIAPLAVLTTVNAFDVCGPMNTPYLFVLVFAVAAFIFVEHARGGWGSVAGLAALSAAAGMGNSAGLATVPVLMIAILRRPERGRLAAFWVVGPILAAVFVASAGQMAAEGATHPEAPLERGLRMLRYFVGFCGLPWSASSQKMSFSTAQTAIQLAARAVSLLLIAAGLGLAARPSRDRTARGRLDRICCSLILFSLTVAAMAVLGRINATPTMQIPIRYAVLLAPLHVGVLVLLIVRIDALRRARPPATAALVAATLALALGHQYLGREVVLRYCARLNQMLAAFDAGERTPAMTQYVHPVLGHAERVTAELKRRGLYR